MSDSAVYHGEDFVAYRYGDRHGNWVDGGPAQISNIVLGHDVDTRAAASTSRAMDFVRPDERFWDPERNSATLSIKDPATGSLLSLALGQWLVKFDSGGFAVMAHNAILEEVVGSAPPKSFEDELADLIQSRWVAARRRQISPKASARFLVRALSSLEDYMNESGVW